MKLALKASRLDVSNGSNVKCDDPSGDVRF
jgi:hypothetical protein